MMVTDEQAQRALALCQSLFRPAVGEVCPVCRHRRWEWGSSLLQNNHTTDEKISKFSDSHPLHEVVRAHTKTIR